jgi:LuxR family maltose regulon positive regulatory protein
MNRECWQQIERWLRLLPRRVIDERPELLMLEAWAMNRSGLNEDFSTGLEPLQALTENKRFPESEHRRLQGEIDALRGFQLYGQGDMQGAVTFARCALEETGLELSSVRGTAWMVLAMALQQIGDLNGAFETLYDGLKEDRYHGNTFPTRLLIALASIQWMEANPKNLTLTAEYLLKLAHERDLPESMSWAHYFLGTASYLRNDLESAEKHFLIVSRQLSTAHSFAYIQSIFGLAATALAQGCAERAREVVESAMPIALERNNHGLVAEIEAFQARLALAQGNKAEAEHWSRQCEAHFLPYPLPAFHAVPFALARVLIDLDTPESLSDASQLLAGMRVSAETAHNTLRQITTLALQALLHDARGEEAEALSTLSQSILLAQPGGVLRPFIDMGPRMASLLSRLLRQGTGGVYLKGILQAFPTLKPAPAPNGAKNLIEPLTDRELEILALLAQRLSNKEIARELVISPMTVKRHTINIYQKLNTNSRREAVDVASALGLFSLQNMPQTLPI